MPDNWGFVFAAYGLTAAALALYWHHLVRKEKALHHATPAASARRVAGTARPHTERARESSTGDRQIGERSREIGERSRQPSSSGHPRPDPTTRGPLQP